METLGKQTSMLGSPIVGQLASETASIAYDGTLLPTGTASYGGELIVNGDFSNGTTGYTLDNIDANNYAEVVGGSGHIVSNGTLVALKTTSSICLLGKAYKIEFDVLTITGSGIAQVDTTQYTFSTTGRHVVYTHILGANWQLIFKRNVTCNYTFDNVSVKEVLINPNMRYLKNSGKDKTPALVESGQGKFFNGTSQYINTGIIPNQAQGTLVTRFTYVTGQVSRCIIGNTEISIWVNASGKIEGLFSNAVITSTDVLVNGRSYHVELPYLGLNASIKVDNVTKASGTASSFIPTLPMAIGARLTAITPTLDRYFNNVIDETYYYDVALPDTAIQSLYLYPEKVKSYNGAIVPDIGYEANCKLFLPMCENSGSNVVNVAVARGSESILNPTADILSFWQGWDGSTVSLVSDNIRATNTTTEANISQITQIPIVLGKAYYISVTVNPAQSGNIYTSNGLANILLGAVTAGVDNIISGIMIGGTNYFNIPIKCIGSLANMTADYKDISIKEITAYPIASYTTAMHTSAAKLPYGAQCTAWKRDSLGVLLGMSNGLSFDGGVSVKPIDIKYRPIDESIAFETVCYIKSTEAVQRLSGAYDANRLYLGQYVDGRTFTRYGNTSAVATVTTGYHHLSIVANKSGSITAYVDGVAVGQTAYAFLGSTVDIVLGALTIAGLNPMNTIMGNFKIHKGAQYAKFDIAKSYAKALKTIAKLGA